MQKYISILCAALLLLMGNYTMGISAKASDGIPLNESIDLDVDIESFESSYTYTKALFNNECISFNKLKDWILSEKCRVYYKSGPYPTEVRKSLYWAETKNQWKDNSVQYKYELVFEDFNVLFSTYQICDILALNKNYKIDLYENPATIVSFHVLSQQYDYEESFEPPLLGFREKLVIIDYTGTETYGAADENDYVEALGNGWYLIMRGYDEHITSTIGDVNADGKFTVADVVRLQKWLLAVPDVTLPNWQAADMCEDGTLNVFDLCMMKHELISQKQFDDTPVLFIDDYIISESPNGWEGEDYERVITANGNKYSIPSFTVDVEEGYEWTFEDDINFIMYNGEKSEYITDSAVLQKLSDFSKKASNYKNCKMKNMGISLVDFGEMKLSVLYKDENENMQSLELFRFGEECAWLDNAEVQEFVKMLIDKGYIDGIYAFMIPQIK